MEIACFIEAADRHCQQQGVKLTALRRQVLELVLSYPGVVKAYQVLADLQKQFDGAAKTILNSTEYTAYRIQQIQQTLSAAGMDLSAQQITHATREQVLAALKSENAGVTLRRTEFVGPAVGSELAADGAKALAFVGIRLRGDHRLGTLPAPVFNRLELGQAIAYNSDFFEPWFFDKKQAHDLLSGNGSSFRRLGP